MDNYTLALQQGNEVRYLQDEVLSIFVKLVRRIDDKKVLEQIKKELQGGL